MMGSESESGYHPVEKSLRELCVTHETDKAWHRHSEIYEDLFRTRRKRVKRILEIGVAGGASLRVWRDYFENATVFGIDKDERCLRQAGRRIVCFQTPQEDRDGLGLFIEKYGSDFDIIIDDGSHRFVDQQVSFGFLFRHLVPKGWYVIEDMFTSWHPEYLKDAGVPTWDWIQSFFKTGLFQQGAMTETETDCIQQGVDRVMLYGNTLSAVLAILKQ